MPPQPYLYVYIFRAPMCRLDRVTSYVRDISDMRAGIESTGAGKSRQGLPQPSKHGSTIPRRSSHLGDRGASLLRRRLRVRRPAKASQCCRDAGQPCRR